MPCAISNPPPDKPQTHPLARRAVLLGLCLAAVGRVRAQPALQEINLVSDEWHDLTRKDGSGLYFDLIRMVYAQRGIKVNFSIFPYPRTVQMVKEKKADGWVASFMKEKDFPLYPKWHFDQNAQMVIYRKGTAAGFSGLPSLANRRVAWLRDFGLDRYIAQPMRITEVNAIQSGLQMLDNDRIDYFVGARSDIADEVKKHHIDMGRYEMKFAMNLGLFLAFADTARGAAFRDLWDREMETLHKTEAFKAVYKKYGYDYPFP